MPRIVATTMWSQEIYGLMEVGHVMFETLFN